ncbi:MAG: hypothetical protein ACRD3S_04210, partial [Terracidiphilus sp.]
SFRWSAVPESGTGYIGSEFWGANYKPLLRRQCKRLGVELLDRTSATALLTEEGAHGARVIGAAGIDCHTGAFVTVRARR